eukprot:g6834.t1
MFYKYNGKIRINDELRGLVWLGSELANNMKKIIEKKAELNFDNLLNDQLKGISDGYNWISLILMKHPQEVIRCRDDQYTDESVEQLLRRALEFNNEDCPNALYVLAVEFTQNEEEKKELLRKAIKASKQYPQPYLELVKMHKNGNEMRLLDDNIFRNELAFMVNAVQNSPSAPDLWKKLAEYLTPQVSTLHSPPLDSKATVFSDDGTYNNTKEDCYMNAIELNQDDYESFYYLGRTKQHTKWLHPVLFDKWNSGNSGNITSKRQFQIHELYVECIRLQFEQEKDEMLERAFFQLAKCMQDDDEVEVFIDKTSSHLMNRKSILTHYINVVNIFKSGRCYLLLGECCDDTIEKQRNYIMAIKYAENDTYKKNAYELLAETLGDNEQLRIDINIFPDKMEIGDLVTELNGKKKAYLSQWSKQTP